MRGRFPAVLVDHVYWHLNLSRAAELRILYHDSLRRSLFRWCLWSRVRSRSFCSCMAMIVYRPVLIVVAVTPPLRRIYALFLACVWSLSAKSGFEGVSASIGKKS